MPASYSDLLNFVQPIQINLTMPINNDQLHRFIFDNTDIRGEIITLGDSYQTLLEGKHYPPAIESLLGEFLTAVALLSSTLKFDGLLTLQARGDGPLPLIMAESDHNQKLRGIAKINDEQPIQADNLPALIGKGVLAITIDPDQGQRYQGIVPLDGPNLADCLEHYFYQSEQLPTKIWLASNGKVASGLLLQQLPRQLTDPETYTHTWENRIQLANTLSEEELLSLDHAHLLTRLFHEEGVRIFDPLPLRFGCSCSKQRSSRALEHLGKTESLKLIAEQSRIEVDCEFCGHQYHYVKADIEALFAPDTHH